MATPFQKIKPKLAFLLILTVITALLLVVCYWRQNNKTPTPPSDMTSQASLYSTSTPASIKQNENGRLPQLFPRDIPLEKNAVVLQNYSQAVGKKEQSTYQFVSAKSLQENFEIYKKYLSDKKWTVMSLLDEPELKSFSAKKSPNYLSITFSTNKQTNQNVIDITMVGPAIIETKTK